MKPCQSRLRRVCEGTGHGHLREDFCESLRDVRSTDQHTANHLNLATFSCAFSWGQLRFCFSVRPGTDGPHMMCFLRSRLGGCPPPTFVRIYLFIYTYIYMAAYVYMYMYTYMCVYIYICFLILCVFAAPDLLLLHFLRSVPIDSLLACSGHRCLAERKVPIWTNLREERKFAFQFQLPPPTCRAHKITCTNNFDYFQGKSYHPT